MDTETARAEWSLRSNRERDWMQKRKVTKSRRVTAILSTLQSSDARHPRPLRRWCANEQSEHNGKHGGARRLHPIPRWSTRARDPVVNASGASFGEDGPGAVYFTVHHRHDGSLIFKWGQSSCVTRRQPEYGACEDEGEIQMWFVVFEVEHRLIAERVIHLRLCEKRYEGVRFYEPCSYGRRHGEYHYMRPNSSLEDFEKIAWECLEELEKFFACAGDVHNTLSNASDADIDVVLSCSSLVVTVCLNEPKNEWMRKRKYEDTYGHKQQDRETAVGELRIPMWLSNKEQNCQWRIRRLLSTVYLR
ncbi:hypothetical protein C8R45DRAFT_923995 [Mycena sanguinolenta]|nr:hypothetical protein C8R45DRAFT_923995 [Mycena sanguinolenta]